LRSRPSLRFSYILKILELVLSLVHHDTHIVALDPDEHLVPVYVPCALVERVASMVESLAIHRQDCLSMDDDIHYAR